MKELFPLPPVDSITIAVREVPKRRFKATYYMECRTLDAVLHIRTIRRGLSRFEVFVAIETYKRYLNKKYGVTEFEVELHLPNGLPEIT